MKQVNMQDQPNFIKRLLIWAVVLATLAAVFMAYTRPEFMVDLANQIWLCF